MSKDRVTTELYRQEGENFRSVRARLEAEQFQIETQDMGPLVEEVWGDVDYEFWLTVPKESWGKLLMAMSIEFLADDPSATDRLRAICTTHDIPHEFGNWT